MIKLLIVNKYAENLEKYCHALFMGFKIYENYGDKSLMVIVKYFDGSFKGKIRMVEAENVKFLNYCF